MHRSRIVDEVERTLVELADRYQRVPDRIAPLIAELQVIAATSTIPTEPIHVVRDPKDSMVIECAVACEADLVVTNDDDLLALKSYESIGIVGIRDFVRTPGVS